MKALTSFVCLNPILVLATTVVAADPDWKSIAEIMAMPEEQVIGLVSEQTPIECPDPASAFLRVPSADFCPRCCLAAAIAEE